ncbi:thioesterase family protein [Roseobacter sp.]|uniref:thioesterase family protein n=1 Tax=Roseobacter sp. TaxID=1907202 RepID=UPI00385F97AE
MRLSPLVEDAQTCAKTSDVFRNIGVLPLTLRREIDAPIADRIREAIWREGLRLIKDSFCTTEEPDEDTRMGFCLQWTQMGLSKTDRIAGAESGMKHFVSRLGSAAKWPWSKLMDMPEFTEDLVNLISGQSDTPLSHLSIRDMERLCDDNLVGRKRKLQQTGTGAGAVIDAQEKQLPEPFQYLGKERITMHRYVPQSRTDCNRHLNKAHYVESSAQATDRFMEMFVCNTKYIAARGSYFTIENRLPFLDDMFEGHLLTVATQLSSGQGKKLHLFHLVKSETGTVSASVKTYLVHIDLTTRRPSEPVGGIQVRIEEIQADNSNLPKPETLGRASRGASPQRDPVP